MNTADPAPRPSPDGLAAPSLRSPLPPGSLMLGVLGGGQLGRMFVHAAQRHGYRVAVLEPDAASPAGAAADLHLDAPYTDPPRWRSCGRFAPPSRPNSRTCPRPR